LTRSAPRRVRSSGARGFRGSARSCTPTSGRVLGGCSPGPCGSCAQSGCAQSGGARCGARPALEIRADSAARLRRRRAGSSAARHPRNRRRGSSARRYPRCGRRATARWARAPSPRGASKAAPERSRRCGALRALRRLCRGRALRRGWRAALRRGRAQAGEVGLGCVVTGAWCALDTPPAPVYGGVLADEMGPSPTPPRVTGPDFQRCIPAPVTLVSFALR
jgi:hypothetical protein